MRKENLTVLTDFFASGCKKEQFFGIELEHFVVSKETGTPLPYQNGVAEILHRFAPIFGTPIFSDGQIIGITGENAEISLEPASQLEISVRPSSCHEEIRKIYADFFSKISPILSDFNCELLCTGMLKDAEKLPLIPKKRYELMDAHFKKTGTHGLKMMRSTAAAQISIDYESESDFSKKFRIANVLTPIFSFLCDTTGKMGRTHIWNNVDPARSGIVPKSLDEPFGFLDYANYIYDMPPIFIMPENEPVCAGNAPNSEIFAAKILTRADVEHITSMAFPDVRLQNRIEIRSADSLPIEKTLEFAALLKKIFYNEENSDKLLRLTRDVKNIDVIEAKKSLIMHGADAEIYKKPVRTWMQELENL
ncbi:MAG: glutamate-cysteine ligase family protein [Defluviitaleaceae bacterium]|nr:glutamate-cysteine ligase family protein [Defluviitaleaceae bacterium]